MEVVRTAWTLGIAVVAGRFAVGQETERVSVDSSGAEGNGGAESPSISANGNIVAFDSFATNFVVGDTNGKSDIFVHDRSTGVTERVSVDSFGAEGDGNSYAPAISADGRIVVFQSSADNLVAGDSNGFQDVFLHDRTTGVTERMSIDSFGAEANGWSQLPTLTPDGQIVVFTSNASNLITGDSNGTRDVFVHDRSTGTTERISVGSSGAAANGVSDEASISADGQIVAFYSEASNLVAGDTNGKPDIFVHDRSTGITERVSVSSSGTQGDNLSGEPSISADGGFVAFESTSTNLVAGDTNGIYDVFVHDRATGGTERVSIDSSGNQGQGGSGSFFPTITADGGIVAFESQCTNLVTNDNNQKNDVFQHDRSTGVTERVSVSSSGTESNGSSGILQSPMSVDGGVVAFTSWGSNLVPGDTNGTFDVFVRDSCSTVATWSIYGAGFPGTSGVPAFTSRQNPMFGATITLDLANSYGNSTVGLLFIGFQRADIPSSRGGDLLVAPSLVIPITLSYGADSFTGNIPNDRSLCGIAIDLQAIELDPGAAKGVSFTQGLELVLGR